MIEQINFLKQLEQISVIIAPLISFIAVIIYAKALRNSKKQNEIILSQSIKSNFEKEIYHLLDEGQEVGYVENKDEHFLKLNIFEALFPLLRNLTNSEEFKLDQRNKLAIDNEALIFKSYNDSLFRVRTIVYENSISYNYFKNIERFIDNVETSKMINEDKYAIKNQLKRSVLKKTINYYEKNLKNLHLTEMYIPKFIKETKEVNWGKLKETHLLSTLDRLLLKLN